MTTQMLLYLLHRQFLKMKQRRCQCRICSCFLKHLREMFQFAAATRSNHRNIHDFTDCVGKLLRSHSFAQAMASICMSMRPPFTTTVKPPSDFLLASIATTTHWLPNLSAASLINCGLRTAAEFTEILSAPARSKSRKSSTVRMPPPTVSCGDI